MTNGKDSLEKVEFAQWGPDGTPIDGEVSNGSTSKENSTNGMTGSEKREQNSWTKRGSSVYRLFTDKVTFIRNGGMTSKYVQFGQTRKEQGYSVKPGQKATILKTLAAVLLTILVAIFVMYVYHQNSALVKENDNLKTTNSALVQEVDHLKAVNELIGKTTNARVNNWYNRYNQSSALVKDLKTTNGALVKELDDLKEKYNQSSALVNDLKTTNGVLVKEVDDWKEKYNQTSALIEDLKIKNAAEAKSMVKQLAKGFKGITTTRFGGIQNYLDAGGKRKAGESFTLNGLSWHLLFERPIFGSYLGVYLCHDFTDFFGHTFRDWSATVTFDLTLVNHEDKGKSKTLNSKKVYEKNAQYNCWGSASFIGIADLYGGFIKEDALEFEVQIKSVDLDLIV